MNTFKIAFVVLALALSGCATTHGVKLTTNTVPVAVPLIYSPAPVAIPRPELPHLAITAEDAKVDGKVVQAYAGSVAALLGYSKQLEKELDNYKTINEAYAGLRQKLIEDWKKNTGVDISIADPTVPKTTP